MDTAKWWLLYFYALNCTLVLFLSILYFTLYCAPAVLLFIFYSLLVVSNETHSRTFYPLLDCFLSLFFFLSVGTTLAFVIYGSVLPLAFFVIASEVLKFCLSFLKSGFS